MPGTVRLEYLAFKGRNQRLTPTQRLETNKINPIWKGFGIRCTLTKAQHADVTMRIKEVEHSTKKNLLRFSTGKSCYLSTNLEEEYPCASRLLKEPDEEMVMALRCTLRPECPSQMVWLQPEFLVKSTLVSTHDIEVRVGKDVVATFPIRIYGPRSGQRAKHTRRDGEIHHAELFHFHCDGLWPAGASDFHPTPTPFSPSSAGAASPCSSSTSSPTLVTAASSTSSTSSLSGSDDDFSSSSSSSIGSSSSGGRQRRRQAPPSPMDVAVAPRSTATRPGRPRRRAASKGGEASTASSSSSSLSSGCAVSGQEGGSPSPALRACLGDDFELDLEMAQPAARTNSSLDYFQGDYRLMMESKKAGCGSFECGGDGDGGDAMVADAASTHSFHGTRGAADSSAFLETEPQSFFFRSAHFGEAPRLRGRLQPSPLPLFQRPSGFAPAPAASASDGALYSSHCQAVEFNAAGRCGSLPNEMSRHPVGSVVTNGLSRVRGHVARSFSGPAPAAAPPPLLGSSVNPMELHAVPQLQQHQQQQLQLHQQQQLQQQQQLHSEGFATVQVPSQASFSQFAPLAGQSTDYLVERLASSGHLRAEEETAECCDSGADRSVSGVDDADAMDFRRAGHLCGDQRLHGLEQEEPPASSAMVELLGPMMVGRGIQQQQQQQQQQEQEEEEEAQVPVSAGSWADQRAQCFQCQQCGEILRPGEVVFWRPGSECWSKVLESPGAATAVAVVPGDHSLGRNSLQSAVVRIVGPAPFGGHYVLPSGGNDGSALCKAEEAMLEHDYAGVCGVATPAHFDAPGFVTVTFDAHANLCAFLQQSTVQLTSPWLGPSAADADKAAAPSSSSPSAWVM